MSDREKTCEERIADQLASRAEDVRKMLAAANGDKVCQHCGERITEETTDDGDDVWCHDEDADKVACREGGNVLTGDDPVATPDEDYTEDSLYDFGLSLTRKVVLRFDMSTGGPADWLEVLCDEERDRTSQYGASLMVERVTYHFSDWFDHAEVTVDEGSPMYELAEWLAEGQQ